MSRQPTPGFKLLVHCEEECRRVLDGWSRMQQVLGAYSQPGANKAELETVFLRLKSELAREIASLSGRMRGDCAFCGEAMGFLSGCTSLDQVFGQSEIAVKKLEQEWHRNFMGMNGQLGEMQELLRRARKHERVMFAGETVYLPPPFPWFKVLSIGGTAAAVLLLVGGSAFARYFLGIGAPAAGVGMEMDPNLSDRDQVYLMMSRLTRAFEAGDLDRFMSAFADDFRDVEGRDKTTLRAFLQTIMSTVGTAGVSVDTGQANVRIDGETGIIGPIRLRSPQFNVDVMIRGKKVEGIWLISYVDEAK